MKEEEEAVKVVEEVRRSETAPKEELKVAGDVESTPFGWANFGRN